MEQQPINLVLSMPVQWAQLVLNALAKLPYEQTADLIASIKSQGDEQLARLQQEKADQLEVTE